jgi:hypothetical protein
MNRTAKKRTLEKAVEEEGEKEQAFPCWRSTAVGPIAASAKIDFSSSMNHKPKIRSQLKMYSTIQ